MRRDRLRFPREIGEHVLGDVLREMRVAVELPQRRRVNEIHMPPHQPREIALSAIRGVTAEGVGIFNQ